MESITLIATKLETWELLCAACQPAGALLCAKPCIFMEIPLPVSFETTRCRIKVVIFNHFLVIYSHNSVANALQSVGAVNDRISNNLNLNL